MLDGKQTEPGTNALDQLTNVYKQWTTLGEEQLDAHGCLGLQQAAADNNRLFICVS